MFEYFASLMCSTEKKNSIAQLQLSEYYLLTIFKVFESKYSTERNILLKHNP